MLLIAILLVVSSSIMILHVESDSQSSIHSASDAVWWSIGTLTMVGDAQHNPATDGGRLIGCLLTIAGIAIFGAFTGYVASWFLAPTEKRQTTEMQEIQSELEALRKAVEELGGKRG